MAFILSEFSEVLILIKRIAFLIIAITVCFLMNGCTSNSNEPDAINWSVSKHSEITGKEYEETQGYKAVFLTIDEITVDRIKEWIDSCDLNDGYYQYIYADTDSWDMFIYYPRESSNIFKFHIADSCVNVYVEGGETSAENLDYTLLLIQAPLKGAWPSSSRLFIDNEEIELN